MNLTKIIENMHIDIVEQNAVNLVNYFDCTAKINWHCTNECFNVDEYIIANCEYPGKWDGKIERMEQIGDLVICASHIYLQDKSESFHVVSFIRFKNKNIIQMDEYWGDDSDVPKWRLDKHIGKKIKN